jgi:hypothetical protein
MTAHWILPRRAARLNAPAFLSPLWNLDRFLDELPLIDRPACAAGKLSFAPAVNVEETEDELRFSAELPGLQEEDFEITTDGDLLTIKDRAIARLLRAELQGRLGDRLRNREGRLQERRSRPGHSETRGGAAAGSDDSGHDLLIAPIVG